MKWEPSSEGVHVRLIFRLDYSSPLNNDWSLHSNRNRTVRKQCPNFPTQIGNSIRYHGQYGSIKITSSLIRQREALSGYPSGQPMLFLSRAWVWVQNGEDSDNWLHVGANYFLQHFPQKGKVKYLVKVSLIKRGFLQETAYHHFFQGWRTMPSLKEAFTNSWL